MEEARTPNRKQTSIMLDEDDWAEVDKIVKAKRSNISQVCRELIVEGLERRRQSPRLEAVG